VQVERAREQIGERSRPGRLAGDEREEPRVVAAGEQSAHVVVEAAEEVVAGTGSSGGGPPILRSVSSREAWGMPGRPWDIRSTTRSTTR
jgi:hypothetical protein